MTGGIVGGVAAGVGVTALFAGSVAVASVVEGGIGYVVRENGQQNDRSWEDRLGNALLKNATRGFEGAVVGGVAGTLIGSIAGAEGGASGAMIGASIGTTVGTVAGIVEGVIHTNQKDFGFGL